MALENQQPETTYKAWPMIGGAIGLVMVIVFSLYYSISASRLEKRITLLTEQKTSLAAEKASGANRATTRAYALDVQNKLAGIEQKQIAWSKIVDTIEKTIPLMAEESDPIVTLRSYTGNAEGRIILSATTRADSADPFTDVSNTIRAFATAPSFAHVFVPSVTKSLTPEGTTVLSFGMNFLYNGASVSTAVGTSTVPTTPTK